MPAACRRQLERPHDPAAVVQMNDSSGRILLGEPLLRRLQPGLVVEAPTARARQAEAPAAGRARRARRADTGRCRRSRPACGRRRGSRRRLRRCEALVLAHGALVVERPDPDEPRRPLGLVGQDRQAAIGLHRVPRRRSRRGSAASGPRRRRSSPRHWARRSAEPVRGGRDPKRPRPSRRRGRPQASLRNERNVGKRARGARNRHESEPVSAGADVVAVPVRSSTLRRRCGQRRARPEGQRPGGSPSCCAASVPGSAGNPCGSGPRRGPPPPCRCAPRCARARSSGRRRSAARCARA